MDHVHLAFLQSLRPRLSKLDGVEHLFRWLAPGPQMVRTSGAREAVESVMDAWGAAPPEDERREICRLVVTSYNDPRLSSGGIWGGMRPELRDRFLRWLTGEDMKFFCDVVTATQDSHMWKPRRDYWLRRFREKRIDEAWVAFSDRAADHARRHLRAGNANRFGRENGRPNTSLLIMRIGRQIVVDGCHSYKTHLFSIDDPKAPKLYQKSYDCERIRRTSKASFSHHFPAWINWIERYV
jgi:hypothetical protein